MESWEQTERDIAKKIIRGAKCEALLREALAIFDLLPNTKIPKLNIDTYEMASKIDRMLKEQ